MRNVLLSLIAITALATPQAAFADAEVTVIHAISGDVLGLAPDLPVDIWVNGEPFLTNVPFLATAPATLPAGTYDVEIFLEGSDPGATQPVLARTFELADGDNVHIIAHLVPGSGIALNAYANNTAPRITEPISPRISARDLRVTVRHLADFGRAAVNRLLPVEPTLANGETLSLEADAGTYRFWLSPAGAPRPLSFEPTAEVELSAGTHYYVYAIGSPVDGSFQLLLLTESLD